MINQRKRFLCCLSFCFLSLQLLAQDSNRVIRLWKNGAPGFENRKDIPEEAKDWWVHPIHNPSLTVFLPPKEIATGAAIVICPGGGFHNLVFNSEGKNPAAYFNKLGVAVFVLKYRLFRMENSGYTEEQPKEDIFRAMRLVRSMAAEFNVDTARIGVMGFSAGGEVAGWVSYGYKEKHYTKGDAIDQLTARPAFQVLIYPGPLAVPQSVDATAPISFLCAANNDDCCSEPIIKLAQMHRAVKVPVELHLYASGDHAFGMGAKSPLTSIQAWPQRLTEWMTDSGLLKKK